MEFDLKKIWKDEEKRKKLIGITALSLISIGALFYTTSLFSDGEDEELTEIPLTEAEEARKYNSKLDAMNNSEVTDTSFSTALNGFFEDKQIVPNQDLYSDEDRKADSLLKVYSSNNSNTKNQGDYYSYNTPTITKPTPEVNQKYNPQTNSFENNYQDKGLSEEDIEQERRNKKLEKLRGEEKNSNNVSYSNSKPILNKSVKGVIRGTQTKSNGEIITLRNSAEFYLNDILIKANTYLYGKINISSNRAIINISSVNIKGKIVPTNISVYSVDGLEGLPISNSNFNEIQEEVTDEAGQVINSKYGKVGRVVNNVFNKKGENNVVFLDNQPIILVVR